MPNCKTHKSIVELCEKEWFARKQGLTFVALDSNTPFVKQEVKQLEFTEANSSVEVYYTPSETGTYSIYSAEGLDWCGEVETLDGDWPRSTVAWNDDVYLLSVYLEAGETYLLTAHNFDEIGTIDLSITKKQTWEYETLDDEDTVAITAYNGGDEAVVVPSILDGKTVTTIDYYAFGLAREHVTEVTLPDTLKSIEQGAFCGCTNLKEIQFPESLESIANYAFESCSSLEEVYLPKNVESIGGASFVYCYELKTIEVDEENEYYSSLDGNLYDSDQTWLIIYAPGKEESSFQIPTSVTYIGAEAFRGCKLSEVTIPDSVGEIGALAFCASRELREIILPDSVIKVGENAFAECTSLEKAVLSKQLRYLEYELFSGCTALESVELQDGLLEIGEAFADCTNLKRVLIPASVTNIAKNAFIEYDYDGETYNNLAITIMGYSGSYAETYAKNNGFTFTIVDQNTSLDKYTIAFNSNGGSKVAKQSVVSGGKATEPATPSRKGYTFAGWYNGKTKYNFSTAVKGNVTLTAKWKPVTYKITYKTNGGTLSSKATKRYTIQKSVSLKKPTRKGYIFAGWYSDSKFKTKVTSIKKGSTGNKTLYAKWTKVSVAKAKLTKATNAKSKKLTAAWKKVSGAKGYRIAYSTSKQFTKSITKTVTTAKTKLTISKLKKGKTYYVKVQAYKVDSAGNKVYGKWSSIKKVKITK